MIYQRILKINKSILEKNKKNCIKFDKNLIKLNYQSNQVSKLTYFRKNKKYNNIVFPNLPLTNNFTSTNSNGPKINNQNEKSRPKAKLLYAKYSNSVDEKPNFFSTNSNSNQYQIMSKWLVHKNKKFFQQVNSKVD